MSVIMEFIIQRDPSVSLESLQRKYVDKVKRAIINGYKKGKTSALPNRDPRTVEFHSDMEPIVNVLRRWEIFISKDKDNPDSTDQNMLLCRDINVDPNMFNSEFGSSSGCCF